MIRLFALDVDGVLTDGQIFYDRSGECIKAFDAHDGLGLKLLQSFGITVAVISGRDSKPLRARLSDLGIKHQKLGVKAKGEALQALILDFGYTRSETSFIGDDLPDLSAMAVAGLSFAPLNAVDAVKAAADIVLEFRGGDGAVRAACEIILSRAGVTAQQIAKKASGSLSG